MRLRRERQTRSNACAIYDAQLKLRSRTYRMMQMLTKLTVAAAALASVAQGAHMDRRSANWKDIGRANADTQKT